MYLTRYTRLPNIIKISRGEMKLCSKQAFVYRWTDGRQDDRYIPNPRRARG